MPPLQSYKRRRVAWQHFPDNQTLRLQTGAGEDDIIDLPSSLDWVDCKRQEEEEDAGSADWQVSTTTETPFKSTENFERYLAQKRCCFEPLWPWIKSRSLKLGVPQTPTMVVVIRWFPLSLTCYFSNAHAYMSIFFTPLTHFFVVEQGIFMNMNKPIFICLMYCFCEMQLEQHWFQINLKLSSAQWPDSSKFCAVEDPNCTTENDDQRSARPDGLVSSASWPAHCTALASPMYIVLDSQQICFRN